MEVADAVSWEAVVGLAQRPTFLLQLADHRQDLTTKQYVLILPRSPVQISYLYPAFQRITFNLCRVLCFFRAFVACARCCECAHPTSAAFPR